MARPRWIFLSRLESKVTAPSSVRRGGEELTKVATLLLTGSMTHLLVVRTSLIFFCPSIQPICTTFTGRPCTTRRIGCHVSFSWHLDEDTASVGGCKTDCRKLDVRTFGHHDGCFGADETTANVNNDDSSLIRLGVDQAIVQYIAEAYGASLSPCVWICVVMKVESASDVHARSSQGAMGLMQIMPRT